MTGVLIVTGGSRGIGAACAIRAAQEGWRVAVNYKSSASAAQAVVDSIATDGGCAIALQGDVTVEDDVIYCFDQTEARLGPVTALINSAGIAGAAMRFTDLTLARWQDIQATNATGTFLFAREALRRMQGAAGHGAIVNMSSMAAVFGAAGEAVDYAASKGAVESMTLGLAKEAAPFGIRVNAIRPGLIDTDMQDDIDPARLARLVSSVPLGRAGTAAEVAEAAIWLISERSSYITGAILPVSGGR